MNPMQPEASQPGVQPAGEPIAPPPPPGPEGLSTVPQPSADTQAPPPSPAELAFGEQLRQEHAEYKQARDSGQLINRAPASDPTPNKTTDTEDDKMTREMREYDRDREQDPTVKATNELMLDLSKMGFAGEQLLELTETGIRYGRGVLKAELGRKKE